MSQEGSDLRRKRFSPQPGVDTNPINRLPRAQVVPRVLLPPAYINSCTWRRTHTRAKGKTAPKKYNVAPDITRRGKKMPLKLNSVLFLFFVVSSILNYKKNKE